MTPYFNCPFLNIDRKNLNIPPAAQPAPFVQPPIQPAPPAIVQPMLPTCVQPFIQPGIPVCPQYGFLMPQADLYPEQMNTLDAAEGIKSANLSDPPPVLSNNPAVASIRLFKELTGYPNYGNPSGNADILYTGNRGTWTIDIPPTFFAGGSQRGQLIIRAVLDDHSNVPVRQYSARITVNGNVVHNGRVPLEHGVPAGGRFTNWVELPFNISNIRRSNRIEIANTSTAGANDWIGLDWMELRITRR